MTAFFDTKILIYAQERSGKGDIARGLLAVGGVLSVQVLNEFASVSRRKQNRSWSEIAEAIEDVLALVSTPIAVTLSTHQQARRLAAAHSFSFYDALIVAAAIEAGCDRLYSEDMQHGRVIGGVRVVNPFNGDADLAR